MIHVAILQQPYLGLVLAGRKTIESRLSKAAVPPYGQIEAGERIFFKLSGGPFMATALADAVRFHDELTPARVDALRSRLNARVAGHDDYWRMKRGSRFATFVKLRDVEPIDVGPAFAKSAYKAWFVLPEAASPLLDVALTAGAIRNGYAPTVGRADFFAAQPFDLLLPDGRCVRSDLYGSTRVRWRGWRAYYQAHYLAPGDLVRFVALKPGRYRVSFKKQRLADRSPLPRGEG